MWSLGKSPGKLVGDICSLEDTSQGPLGALGEEFNGSWGTSGDMLEAFRMQAKAGQAACRAASPGVST